VEAVEISENQYDKADHIIPNIQGYSVSETELITLFAESGGIGHVYADIYSQGGQDSSPKSMYNIYLDLGVVTSFGAFKSLIREVESMYLLGNQTLLERYWSEFRILK